MKINYGLLTLPKAQIKLLHLTPSMCCPLSSPFRTNINHANIHVECKSFTSVLIPKYIDRIKLKGLDTIP